MDNIARCAESIGNDLDVDKWWRKKIVAVRGISRKWTTIARQGYFGKSLIRYNSSHVLRTVSVLGKVIAVI